MLQINLGDIGTRVVRALGVRGRVPFSLDENVVPVAMLQDLTDSLYAQNPATFMVTFNLAGATPNVSVAWMGNRQPDLVTKLDAMFIVDASSVAPTTPVVVTASRNTGVPAGSSFGGGGILNQPTAAANVGGPLLTRLRTQMETNTPAASPFASWTNLYQLSLGQGLMTPILIPLGVVLYQNDGFGMSIGVEAAGVSKLVTIYGREFSRG